MTRVSVSDCMRFSLVAQGAVIGIDDEDDSTFTITVDQKTFHFQGEGKGSYFALSPCSPYVLPSLGWVLSFAFVPAVHLLSHSLSLTPHLLNTWAGPD